MCVSLLPPPHHKFLVYTSLPVPSKPQLNKLLFNLPVRLKGNSSSLWMEHGSTNGRSRVAGSNGEGARAPATRHYRTSSAGSVVGGEKYARAVPLQCLKQTSQTANKLCLCQLQAYIHVHVVHFVCTCIVCVNRKQGGIIVRSYDKSRDVSLYTCSLC